MSRRSSVSRVRVKVRVGLSAVALMPICLVAAVPANADAASDFLAALAEQGLNVGDTPVDVQLTLAAATEICQLILYDGYTPAVASRQVHYLFPNATPEQSIGFVEAAQKSKLCTEQYAPVGR